MKKSIKILAAAVMVVICVIAGIAGILYLKPKEKGQNLPVNKSYDASDAIQIAIEKLNSKPGMADIITDVQTVDKVAALNFKGMSNSETNKKILKLLEQYSIKSTFFLPGIQAAEDSGIVKLMAKDGHRVESNTLTGKKNIEKESQKQLIEDFCRTNNILKTLAGRSPELLMCNSTEYTDKLLKAAEASGYKAVVAGTNYLSYQSFRSYEQTLEYVKSLNSGTVLTVKLDGPLNKEEYTNTKKNEKPAVDKKAGTNTEESSLSEEERLVQVVGWLLKAINENRVHTVFTADINDYKDADFQRDFSLDREKNKGKLAAVYTKIVTGENLLSLSFRGIGDKEKLAELLDFLKENNLKATFFVTGDDIINNVDSIQKIIEKGNQIGNGGLTGGDITSDNFNQICFEIYKCDKLLKERYGITADLFMPGYGKYNDSVREAVSALGYKLIAYTKNPITDSNMTLQDITKYYKNGFQSGDIIFFRLDYYKDLVKAVSETYELAEKQQYQFASVKVLLAKQAIMVVNGEKPGTDTTGKNGNGNNNTGTNNSGKNNIGGGIENNQEKDLIKQLRAENHGKLATQVSMAYTTEQALSYTFAGLSNTKVVKDVLNKLDSLNAKGTFFVTEEETVKNTAAIKEIAAAGHEIEICLNPLKGEDFDAVCKNILTIQKAVEKICGQKPSLVRCAYVIDMPKAMLEAISSTGCRVVWQGLSFASSTVGKQGTFKNVVSYVYNDGNISAKRGDIVYFRLDYYEDPSLIGKLLVDFTKNRVDTIAYNDNGKLVSSYNVRPLKELLTANENYTYPVAPGKVLTSLKDRIYPGHLDDLSKEDLFSALKDRYVGNPAIVSTALPGFSEEELSQLDKSGTFTGDKVLFLTFDDWGSDKPINQILYVLNKYHIKANFFIRTNYLESNPNLLRAIALSGHDVGSHSDQHLPFAISNDQQVEDDTMGEYSSITAKEAKVRRADLQVSFNKLLSIIGDVKVNGKPALTTIFRPPTLAMSKRGMEAILDMGFSHIVSGDFSTHDYEAKNPKELVETLLHGIELNDGSFRTLKNGSVIVLHMSDDSNTPNNKNDVTAEALDIVIPQLLQEGYHFARLSEYLTENLVQ